MAVFDQLARASFDGIAFPVEEVEVSCQLRHVIHKYPHSPGGALEKLGRELYTVRMRGNFQTRFAAWGDNLWPGDLSDLRDRFENELTSDLVIPTIGTIKACMIDFKQVQTAKIRSGEKADFVFVEDQSSAFLVNGLINVTVDMPSSLDQVTALADAADVDLGSLFDTITGLVNSVTAIGDQIELQGSLLTTQLDGIAAACQAMDERFSSLDEPDNWELMGAIHDLWYASVAKKADVLRKVTPIVIYTTPAIMSVSDVAVALYGDTSRSSELMQLNAFADVFRIAANTNVRAYAA